MCGGWGSVIIKETFKDQMVQAEALGQGLECNGGSESKIVCIISIGAPSLWGTQTDTPAPWESCSQPHCCYCPQVL